MAELEHPVDPQRVEAVRTRGLPAAEAEHLAGLLALLADPLRARLLTDGVATEAAAACDDPTTLALAELDAGGAASYHFYVAGTAAPGLTAEDAPRALTPEVEALHVGTLGLVLTPMADVHSTAVVSSESPFQM